jgi:hypothetical protein
MAVGEARRNASNPIVRVSAAPRAEAVAAVVALASLVASCSEHRHAASAERRPKARAIRHAPGLRYAHAACRLAGEARFADGEQLYADGSRTRAIGRFFGAVVAVEVDALQTDPHRGAQVSVHAPLKGPGLTLRGWVTSAYLPLRAARDIEVVGRNVVLERGAPLQLVESSAQVVRVEAGWRDFDGAWADVGCDALSLVGGPERGSDEGPWVGRAPAHLRGERLTLHASADGPAAVELRAVRMNPTVYVEAHRVRRDGAGMSKIHYRRGLRLDGWVPDAELAPGDGPDCDDCDGLGVIDVADRCPSRSDPASVDDVDGCPESDLAPLAVTERADVLDSSGPEAVVIGELDAGADVYVFETRNGLSRFGPGTGDLREARGGGLWVRSGALAPRRSVTP